jgi:hypothetical protein
MAKHESTSWAMTTESHTWSQSHFLMQITAQGPPCGQPASTRRTWLTRRFLIRSRDKAVLHTGDVRADTTFIKSLRVNPALSEFVEPATVSPFPPAGHWGKKTLDRIYLDTSAVYVSSCHLCRHRLIARLGTGDMPDRDPVLAELVEQMSMYPHDTIFFLNVWCFG